MNVHTLIAKCKQVHSLLTQYDEETANSLSGYLHMYDISDFMRRLNTQTNLFEYLVVDYEGEHPLMQQLLSSRNDKEFESNADEYASALDEWLEHMQYLSDN